MKRQIGENISIAWRSIRGQLLRTILTILIIAFGIMSLVGMLTAIDVLKEAISDRFLVLGANTFTIQNRGLTIRIGQGGQRPKKHPEITYDQAMRFKNAFDFPATASVSANATGTGILKYGSKKTHPNTPIIGCDENYILTGGYEIKLGRNFSKDDITSGANHVIIGSEHQKNFFEGEDPIGASIWIGTKRYTIIGVLKEKGSGLGMSNDRICLIPINNLRMNYRNDKTSYAITVLTSSPTMMDVAIGEATGLFRVVRGDKLNAESSFNIEKSDNVINQFLNLTQYVSLGAVLIAVITLLGAVIGLLNIMLVSVKERTREIGVRKAIGATRQSIAVQFLIEAILICQLGGLCGTAFGILIGNIVTAFVGGSFLIPWLWIIMSAFVCLIVGVASGLYPAIQASRLDPVETLRYE